MYGIRAYYWQRSGSGAELVQLSGLGLLPQFHVGRLAGFVFYGDALYANDVQSCRVYTQMAEHSLALSLSKPVEFWISRKERSNERHMDRLPAPALCDTIYQLSEMCELRLLLK